MRTAIALLVCSLTLGIGTVLAEKDSSVGITQKTYEAITEIQALLDAEQWGDAQTEILAL